MKLRAIAAIAVAAALTGCAATTDDDAAQASSTYTVSVQDRQFRVEVANTPQAQRQGLSGRQSIPPGTGMLFPFTERGEHDVWMAGMQTRIDVAWIDGSRVVAIDTLHPCTATDQTTCPRWTSPEAVDSLLEVPAGALAGITAGATITIREDTSS